MRWPWSKKPAPAYHSWAEVDDACERLAHSLTEEQVRDMTVLWDRMKPYWPGIKARWFRLRERKP